MAVEYLRGVLFTTLFSDFTSLVTRRERAAGAIRRVEGLTRNKNALTIHNMNGRLIRILTLLAAVLAACGSRNIEAPNKGHRYPRDWLLRYNHIQAKGSHNSYHIENLSLIHISEPTRPY